MTGRNREEAVIPGRGREAAGAESAKVESAAGKGGEVAGVVLAAGSSSRMGRNKLLLEIAGEAMVRRAARTAIAAGLAPVVVVTGHERDRVENRLRGLKCRIVHNPDHADGQHTSLRAGIEAASGCRAVVVTLADMPLVTPAMLQELARRHRETEAPLVVSRPRPRRAGGESGAITPPILYARSLFPELLAADRRCGRAVAARHLASAAEVTWGAEALKDIDKHEEWHNIPRNMPQYATHSTMAQYTNVETQSLNDAARTVAAARAGTPLRQENPVRAADKREATAMTGRPSEPT